MNPYRSLSAITRRALRINYTSPAVCVFRAISSGSGSGSGVAVTAEINPVTRKLGPAGLTLTKPSADSVRLQWDTPTYIYAYVVYRATAAVGPYMQVTAGLIGSGFVDVSLAPGTYYYKVTGIEADYGETYPSPVQAVTLP